MKKIYDKLVRDRIPEIISSSGKVPIWDRIPGEEMLSRLEMKLQEETQEYLQSRSAEEIADILEVLHALCAYQGIEWEDVELIRQEKGKERGGFEKGIRLVAVQGDD
ncbi:MAG: nucleoside triphosphate pyrophosphohydrolase [Clostridia bacterium]|nr:nucleoside triphosphate pyrophosphohydrolase [Clostridia bacterium]